MSVGWALLLTVSAACDDGQAAPQPSAPPREQVTHPEPEPEPERPAESPPSPCTEESECVVVEVDCASPAAAHTADAAALRGRLEEEHEGEHCRRTDVPHRLAAYCDGRCRLDDIRYPDLRSCAPGRDDECVLLDSPCGTRAFRADRRRDAERLLASPESARRCRAVAEMVGDPSLFGDPDRPMTARCVRGYCREVDTDE